MIYTFPFISALIGWLTNYIAVKMLFHPRVPINILGIKIQGVFPKRHKMFAEKIGNLVGGELFSFNDIKDKLVSADNMDGVSIVIEEKIDIFLREKLVAAMPMLGMIMGDDLRNKIKATLLEEFNTMLPEVIEKYASKVEDQIDIKEIVKNKVEAFSFEKLEEVMFSIMSKEFKFIELIGAILGFLIGLIQVGLIMFAA